MGSYVSESLELVRIPSSLVAIVAVVETGVKLLKKFDNHMTFISPQDIHTEFCCYYFGSAVHVLKQDQNDHIKSFFNTTLKDVKCDHVSKVPFSIESDIKITDPVNVIT